MVSPVPFTSVRSSRSGPGALRGRIFQPPTAHVRRSWSLMKDVKKQNLPQKDCLRCGRPFAWRRKWARDWDQVRYCSERCRRGNLS